MVAKPVTGRLVFACVFLTPIVPSRAHTRRGAGTPSARWRQSLWNTHCRAVGEGDETLLQHAPQRVEPWEDASLP